MTHEIPVDVPPDQDDLINASVLASERSDHTMLQMFESIAADHDAGPCPAGDGPCNGYLLARDYIAGRVLFGGAPSVEGGAAS